MAQKTQQAGVQPLASAEHPVALLLGSGFKALAGLVKPVRRVPYERMEGFATPAGAAAGESVPQATVGTIDGVPCIVYPVRLHLYQGYSAYEVATPVRHAAASGARVALLVGACGSLSAETGAAGPVGVAGATSLAGAEPTGVSATSRMGAESTGAGAASPAGAAAATAGEPVLSLVSDHINLTGENPLVEWRAAQATRRSAARLGVTGSLGPRTSDTGSFVPMGQAYDPELRDLARRVAAERGIELGEGVYAEVKGPSLETAAEARALRALGADFVGMSLSLEVIMARALGLRVLALTLPTNPAGAEWVTHRSVRAEATSAASELAAIVRGLLRNL